MHLLQWAWRWDASPYGTKLRDHELKIGLNNVQTRQTADQANGLNGPACSVQEAHPLHPSCRSCQCCAVNAMLLMPCRQCRAVDGVLSLPCCRCMTLQVYLALSFVVEAMLMGLHKKHTPLDRVTHECLFYSMLATAGTPWLDCWPVPDLLPASVAR